MVPAFGLGLPSALFSEKPEFAEPLTVTQMKEILERELKIFKSDKKFAVGEFVVPRDQSPIDHQHHRPFIVIETNYDALPDFSQELGTPHYGRRPQVRVAMVKQSGDETLTLAYWGESFDFEPYTDDHRKKHEAVISETKEKMAKLKADWERHNPQDEDGFEHQASSHRAH
jgi:hypothetical protein